jgi:gamma-glutamyltranspeptidase/glutathione hydrolase
MKRSVLLSVMIATSLPQSPATADEQTVHCKNGVVVSVNGPASDIGLAIQQRGGNAVDSAIATAFALAVTYPAAGNIGGGGYLLVMPPKGDSLVFDFREVAPAAATREMFVDPAGRTPHRRVGVPGAVRGLALAHERLGKLPWRDLVQPAVELASDGFAIDAANARSLNDILGKSDKSRFAELHRVFGKSDGTKWQAGDRLKQPDLAGTLQRIADQGADGFYTGETADKIVAEMKLGGGLITADDLAAYQAVTHAPLRGTYRGFDIVSAPPSCSGGTVLIEALNILECFQLDRDANSPANVHRIVEAMKRAFRDRYRYLGDPLATTIPDFLIDKAYARKLAAGITDRATPSGELAGDIKLATESEHTTHLSVIDKDRMAVSLTTTLENLYGSRVVVRGAGFLLNDEMNDFNWLPGVTDATGRVGTDANLVRPGMRMLSSMTPTIVAKGGSPVLVTGSPGGRTISNTVLCVVTNVFDQQMDVRHAVDAPRLHHAWFPDQIQMESAWLEQAPKLVGQLVAMGHTIVVRPTKQGDAHSIWIDPGTGELTGAADLRTSGKASGY